MDALLSNSQMLKGNKVTIITGALDGKLNGRFDRHTFQIWKFKMLQYNNLLKMRVPEILSLDF